MLNISNYYDNKKNTIENIVSSIVNCKDSIYVEEIYAKEASFQKDGTLGNWVSLMVRCGRNMCMQMRIFTFPGRFRIIRNFP